MDKFEYKILNVDRAHMKQSAFQEELMAKLNRLGKEGWEVITIEGMTEGSYLWRVGETVEVMFILKRRIQ